MALKDLHNNPNANGFFCFSSSRNYTVPDPPGLFDGHVWPMYIKHKKVMESLNVDVGKFNWILEAPFEFEFLVSLSWIIVFQNAGLSITFLGLFANMLLLQKKIILLRCYCYKKNNNFS